MKKILITLLLLFNFSFCFTMTKSETIKNMINYYNNTKYKNISHIVIAITILETGWYKSKIHNEYKNYYSVKRKWTKECNDKPILCMRKFKTFKEANNYMLFFFNNRGYRTTEKEFFEDLIKLGYAEDPLYVKKVKDVICSLKKRNLI